MKKIVLILITLSVAGSPLLSLAQAGPGAAAGGGGAATAQTEGAAVEAGARAADAIGVPTRSEAGAKTAGATAATKSQVIYNWIEQFVRTTLRKALLDRLVDQIISSIQGNGKPQFVTDWQGFLADAGQIAAGNLIKESGLGFLCSPFSLQIQLSLFPVKKFSQQAECTLDQVVQNIQSFYDDFRSGGWIAFSTAWEPQNNYIGARIMVSQELMERKEAAETAALSEALAGGGYLSAKDKNGNIITPGSTAKDLVSEAVTSDIKFLFTAEQLGDYASAISNALVNRLLKEGLAAVRTATSRSAEEAETAQYNNLINDNFANLKNTLLSQIAQVVEPRQEANSIIDITGQNLNQYKTNLQKLYNDFTATGKTFCSPPPSQPYATTVNVAQTKQQILAQITETNNAISQLQQEKANNQASIDLLIAKRDEIEILQPSNSSLIKLQALNNDIAYLLDPAGADNFRSAKQTQSDTINQNINSQLSAFNKQLQQCQTSP